MPTSINFDKKLGFVNGTSIVLPSGPTDFSTKSLSFDGVDEYMIANLDGTSTGGVLASADTDVDVTISLWFKIPSLPSTDKGLFQWSNTLTSIQPFILFQIRTTGNFRIYVDNGYRFSQPISINTWYNVVLIRTASTNTWTLYFNDSLVNTYNDGGVMTYRNNALSIYLGNGYNGYINGFIDELAIWNSDRTTDITTIYNNGKPADLTSLNPTSWYRAGENSTFAYPQILMPEDANKDKVSKYSLDFDGSFDLITMGNVLNLQDDGTESYSISCWFKTTDTSIQILVSKQLNTSPFNGYNLALGNNQIRFFLGTTTSNARVQGFSATIASISDGNWHHVALTYDGSQDISGVTLYYDNTTPSITTNYNNTPGAVSNNADFMIAARGIAGASYGEAFNGNIDEVAFWTTELSPTTVSSIYNNGVPTDIASLYPTRLEGYWKLGEEAKFTNTWLVPNSALSNFSKYSFNFDGTDDYISIGTNSLGITSAITVSAWVKIPTTNTGGGGTNIQVIACEDATSGGARNWNLFWRGTGYNYFALLIYHTNGLSSFLSTTGITPNDGQWHHILGTYDGTTNANGMKLYIDGVLNAQRTTTSTGINAFSSSEPAIGATTGGGSWRFEGNIDEVAIWDSELSAGEVTAIYNGGKPKDLSGNSPVSWWRMGEEATYDSGTSQFTIPDQAGTNNGTSSNTMLLETLVGDTPQYFNAGTSLGLDIFDRHGDAPNSENNTVSFNMEEVDIVEDTP